MNLVSFNSLYILVVPPLCLCSQNFKTNLNLIRFTFVVALCLGMVQLCFASVLGTENYCIAETTRVVIAFDQRLALRLQAGIYLVHSLYLFVLWVKTKKWMSEGKTNRLNLGFKILNLNFPFIYE